MFSDLHYLTSLSSDFRQVGEALKPPLMVMEGPHCHGMTIEDDQIYFYLQDSLCDPYSPIKIHLFRYQEAFKMTIINSKIHSLNGWNNLTWKALL